VWNYLDKTVVQRKYFKEEPYSVAMHPSGLHLLVGFGDKLRLMNVLMEDIVEYKEFPIKSCRECRFSHGGQYFAAVNGSTIQIFSTYSCENICNLRGHTAKVRSVYWAEDDQSLVSSGQDCAVWEWDLRQGTRAQEFEKKGCPFSSAVCTGDRRMYAVGADATIKEIHDSRMLQQVDAGVTLTQVATTRSPQKHIFAAATTGQIQVKTNHQNQ
jgi:WD40 repeat protein